jgi:hypothetical protein
MPRPSLQGSIYGVFRNNSGCNPVKLLYMRPAAEKAVPLVLAWSIQKQLSVQAFSDTK